MCYLCFFFFKQKTAYEMRISVWSSYVCSSDLGDKELFSRLGGDEFQIILPDQEDRGKLGDLARDIIASLSQPYSVEGSRRNIGASVGVAIASFVGMTSDDLVRNADLAR